MTSESIVQKIDVFNLPVFEDANIWGMWPTEIIPITKEQEESNKIISIFNSMNTGIPLMPHGKRNGIIVRCNENGNRLGFTGICKKDSRMIFVEPSLLDDYWDILMFNYEQGTSSKFKKPISTKGLDEFIDLRDFEIKYSQSRLSIIDNSDCIEDEDDDDDEIQGTPCVYFIYSPINNAVKIGTTDNERRRYRTIRTMSPVPLVFVGSIEGSYEKENLLHRKFSDSRIHGEWFTVNQLLNEYLVSLFGMDWK